MRMPIATSKQIEEEFGKDYKPEDFVVQRFGRWKFLVHIPSGCPVGVKRCRDCPSIVKRGCQWIKRWR